VHFIPGDGVPKTKFRFIFRQKILSVFARLLVHLQIVISPLKYQAMPTNNNRKSVTAVYVTIIHETLVHSTKSSKKKTTRSFVFH